MISPGPHLLLTDYVDLSGCRKCCEGSQREIYEHPAAPDVLIKVIKAEKRGAGGTRRSRRFGALKKHRRFGAYMTFRREIEEYLEQARKFDAGRVFSLPLARILGLTQTSAGLGLLVEKVATSDGRLAPTLSQLLIKGALEQQHLDLIDQFFDTCRQMHIVLMDINADNFVVTDRSGRPEIVCIDGTGEKSFLRLYASSRWLNGLKLRAARRKLLDKLEGLQASLARKPITEASLSPLPQHRLSAAG